MDGSHKSLLSDDEQRIQEVKKFIDNNFKKELEVGLLAKQFSYSRNTLKRHFYAIFKESVTHYIYTLRMKEAMRLLLDHKVSISQIGFEVGYSDRTAFTKAFTKFFNHPPIFFSKDDDAHLESS